MPVDTTIQYNDHNSYRVDEVVFCWPFGVDGMDYITHSFAIYATSVLSAANRAQTTFFTADGIMIGTPMLHSFGVPAIFTLQEITLAVPAGAVLCQMAFLPVGTWWVAEPKTEQGTNATPYTTNYAGHLTYITPNGVYTGMIVASQIVVAGSLANPTEQLNQRLVTINNNQINLSSTLTGKTTNITAEGIYTGALNADQITTGKLQSIDGKTYFDLANAEIKQTTTIGGKVVTVTISPNRPFELSIDGRKHVYITDSTGKSGSGVLVTNICDVNEDGVVDWDDLLLVRSHVLYGTPTLAEYPRMDVNGDGVVNAADLTMIRRAMVRSDYVEDGYSNTKLGVNDIGVYVTNPSGVTSYIHTW